MAEELSVEQAQKIFGLGIEKIADNVIGNMKLISKISEGLVHKA